MPHRCRPQWTLACRWLLAGTALIRVQARADEPGATRLSQATSPQRIVAIAPNSAEVICELGACDRIVGVSKFCVHPPELLERPRVGGFSDPDLERIAALLPDLLVMRGKNEALERLCESLRVPIYVDETDTLPGIKKCLLDLGARLGLDAQARQRISEFEARLDRVRRQTAHRPKPRVLLTVSRQPDRLANILTTGHGTFLDQALEIAGGVNVFGDLDMAYPQVSPEAIVAQQPEVILELMPELELTDEVRERMLRQWRELAAIPAVANNRVHIITDDNCLIPSPRYVEVIAHLAQLLHPEPADEANRSVPRP